MAYDVYLEPTPFNLSRYANNDGVEQILQSQYDWTVRQALGRAVLTETFDEASVPEIFGTAVDGLEIRSAVAQAVRSEKVFRGESAHISAWLQNIAPGGVAAQELSINSDFVDDIKHQLTNLPYDFDILKKYHSAIADTPYLKLAAEVNALDDLENHSHHDEAYELVKEAIKTFEDYAVKQEVADSLLLITFLPQYGRSYTRRLLVNATSYVAIKEALGEVDADEAEMLEALRTYFVSEPLSTNTWSVYGPPKDYLSEANRRNAMANDNAGADALLKMQALNMRGKGRRVISAWDEFSKNFEHQLRDANTSNRSVMKWQLIDRGHGLSGDHGVNSYSFMKLWDTPIGELTQRAEVVKSGEKAIILEDDPSQMEMTTQMLNDHSRFNIVPELQFKSPDGVVEAAHDPNNRLIVLDTQIGNDSFAGLRIAEAVLSVRQNLARSDDTLPDTTIILWSSSKELAKQASDALEKRVDAPGSMCFYELFNRSGSHGSSGGIRIRIKVGVKAWTRYDFDRTDPEALYRGELV